jgi:hypothetical protein
MTNIIFLPVRVNAMQECGERCCGLMYAMMTSRLPPTKYPVTISYMSLSPFKIIIRQYFSLLCWGERGGKEGVSGDLHFFLLTFRLWKGTECRWLSTILCGKRLKSCSMSKYCCRNGFKQKPFYKSTENLLRHKYGRHNCLKQPHRESYPQTDRKGNSRA